METTSCKRRRRERNIELTNRQRKIVELVRQHAPITGERLAEMLGVTRPMIRSDLGLLVMLRYLDAKPKVGYFLGSAARKESALGIHMLMQRRVRDAMGLPIALRETATVGDAVATLFLENVGSLIVTDETGALSGIVSRKDLLKVSIGNSQAPSVPLGMVMTRYPNLVTIGPDETVFEAMRKMIVHEVDGLPVVQREGDDPRARAEPLGRITKTSILKLLYEAANEEE